MLKRETISAVALDKYLTRELHKTAGFEMVRLSAGFRLRVPDKKGCNWSGNITHIHGIRAPSCEKIDAALAPIVKVARERFNMAE